MSQRSAAREKHQETGWEKVRNAILFWLVVILIFIIGIQYKRAVTVQKEMQQSAMAAEMARMEAQAFKREVVHHEQGLIAPIWRQMMNDPLALGYSGDISDKEEVLNWANRLSYLVAVGVGIIGHDGREIRVNSPETVKCQIALNSDQYVVRIFYQDENGKWSSLLDLTAGLNANKLPRINGEKFLGDDETVMSALNKTHYSWPPFDGEEEQFSQM